MKFKYLIIIFTVIIIFFIIITVMLPFLLAGPDFPVNMRLITVPLVIFMIVLLVVMSVFFLSNYRLFSLLEREDWPALSCYLEKIIFEKGKYSSRNVRLLASSYLVVTDYPSVNKLEKKVMAVKPSLVRKNVLVFGAAKILSGNHRESAVFFNSFIGKGKKSENQWIQWFYGFSFLLCGDFSSAEPEFSSLAVSSDDAVITGLSSFFLENTIAKHSLKHQECNDTAQTGKQRVIKSLKNLKGWANEAEKLGTEIHIAIIKKYIDETGKWIFA